MAKIISKKDKKFQNLVENFPTIDLIPFKRILNNSGEYIKLVEDGYLQIMELPSKDTYSLGEDEVNRTLINWYGWLSRFSEDFTIHTTKLPTDTTNQINYQKSCLNQVRNEIKNCTDSRLLNQLRDREQLLLEEINVEGLIRNKIYNVEFFAFLFGKTKRELDETVRKSKIYGNNDFVPREISREKKIQILQQHNNSNEKL